MRPTRPRRPWLRRLAIGLATLAGLVAIVLVAAWLSLPWLVTRGFHAATRELGMEEATIQVPRADLSALRVQAAKLRLGGLGLSLDEGAVTYSPGSLLAGSIHGATIEGLTLTLDFTRPRRSLLPDAIGDLLARFSGGGDLVWPVDQLTLRTCRLVLVLPEGSETIQIEGAATRRPDGLVALELQASDPDQHLSVHGAIRTETLDGELAVDRLSLRPATLLRIARQLDIASMPADTSIEVERIELSATLALKGGLPEAFTVSASIPTARLSQAGIEASLESLAFELRQAPGGAPTGRLSTILRAADSTAGWRFGPAPLQIDLAGDMARGRLEASELVALGTGGGHIALEIESGLPALGGTPRARARLRVIDLRIHEQEIAPWTATLEGWIDRLSLEIPRLALAGESPVEVVGLAASISDPLGANRAGRLAADIVATPSAPAHLPQGWAIGAPAFPAALARLEVEATSGASGLAAKAALRAAPGRVHIAHGESAWTGNPRIDVSIHATSQDVAATATVTIDEIEVAPSPVVALPARASLRLEMPRVPLRALTALAAGQSPQDDFTLAVDVAAERDGAHAQLASTLAREAAAGGWRATVSGRCSGLNGSIAGLTMTEGGGELTFDSGSVTDAVATTWMQARNLPALLESLLPLTKAHLAFSASAIESAGAARLEWVSASFDKAPAGAGDAPLQASARLGAGILRSGPEILEQPAVEIALAGDLATQRVTLRATTLLEGTPLTLEAHPTVTTDLQAGIFRGSGNFALQPFALTYSDILSRWMPDMKGVSVSGTLGVEGSIEFASDGAWDGKARARLDAASLSYPDQDIRVEGLFADIAIDSLAGMRTEPGQRIGFSRLLVNDIAVSDALLQFRTASSSVVHVEGASFRAFDGTISAEPFSLYFPDADVALDLRMRDLDAGQLVRTFDLFRGSITGRLQGRLPIGLLAGKPIIGEGFLELQPGSAATLSVDAAGLFTSGLPDRTAIEKINRLPHELLEDGLANLQLKHFRVDLFRRDQPDRPIEIVLGGVARTKRADVPIELTVHLHGSMSEVIDMLLQLAML